MNKDRNKSKIRVVNLASPEAAAQYINYWEERRPDFQFIQTVPYIYQRYSPLYERNMLDYCTKVMYRAAEELPTQPVFNQNI